MTVNPSSNMSALQSLIGMEAAEFFRSVAGREYRISRAAHPDGLPNLREFDVVVSGQALSPADIRLIKDGVPLERDRYTTMASPPLVEGSKVVAALKANYTLVANRLHHLDPKCGTFARRLGEDLQCPVAVNAYFTPADSRGLSPHYDHHDVFVVQVEGEKTWRISPPVVAAPTMHESWRFLTDAQVDEIEKKVEPPTEIVLRAGDVLYLPRGWMHSATAQERASFHITISADPVTRKEALIQLIEMMSGKDDWFRQESNVYLGGPDEDTAEELRQALVRLSAGFASVSWPGLKDAVQRASTKDLGTDGAKVIGSVLGMARPAEFSTYRRRAGLRWSSHALDETRVAIQLPGAKLALPEAALSAVDLLLNGREVTRSEVAGLLDDDDVADQLIGVLLQAGALEPCP